MISSAGSRDVQGKVAAETLNHTVREGQIAQAQEMLGLQHLMKMNRLHRKNQEAESSAVRQAAWGKDPDNSDEDDLVGDNLHLGEVNQHYYPTPERRSGVSPVAAALLGMAIPTAGGLGALGAYLATKPDNEPTPVVEQSEQVEYGLRLAPPEPSD